ncbi:hypothetical protein NDU88_003431 [Pleurodeles waltl]|uniref:Uncharacterized protein n=1 Tax=Pleurodeles waltl TaxID=8319 RepID=A0AAV7NQV9_PLEWA|nr:hypothetical protein NDU88_003431 [Pleurodeles waltl]
MQHNMKLEIAALSLTGGLYAYARGLPGRRLFENVARMAQLHGVVDKGCVRTVLGLMRLYLHLLLGHSGKWQCLPGRRRDRELCKRNRDKLGNARSGDTGGEGLDSKEGSLRAAYDSFKRY